MSDEDLIGYLFDLLSPEDRAAVVTRLARDPDLVARLEHLRHATLPVLVTAEFERENPPEPAPGLALRAIARVARHVVAHEPREAVPEAREPAVTAFLRDFSAAGPSEFEFETGTRAKVPRKAPTAPPASDGPEPPQPGRRFRADLVVAAGIAFLGFGLITSGIAKARQQQTAAKPAPAAKPAARPAQKASATARPATDQSVAAQQARAKGFALDMSMGGPDSDDQNFKESA